MLPLAMSAYTAVSAVGRGADATLAALRERRMVGMPLHRLAASQIVTRAARRRWQDGATTGRACPDSR